MNKVQVAGGIIIAPDGKIVIVSQNGNSWSLPKGHVDPGESLKSAAIREIAEETGLTDVTFVRELGSYERYRMADDPRQEDRTKLKHITIFLYTSDHAVLRPTDPENPEARWATIDQAMGLLTHPKDRDFLRSVRESLTV